MRASRFLHLQSLRNHVTIAELRPAGMNVKRWLLLLSGLGGRVGGCWPQWGCAGRWRQPNSA